MALQMAPCTCDSLDKFHFSVLLDLRLPSHPQRSQPDPRYHGSSLSRLWRQGQPLAAVTAAEERQPVLEHHQVLHGCGIDGANHGRLRLRPLAPTALPACAG